MNSAARGPATGTNLRVTGLIPALRLNRSAKLRDRTMGDTEVRKQTKEQNWVQTDAWVVGQMAI